MIIKLRSFYISFFSHTCCHFFHCCFDGSFNFLNVNLLLSYVVALLTLQFVHIQRMLGLSSTPLILNSLSSGGQMDISEVTQQRELFIRRDKD